MKLDADDMNAAIQQARDMVRSVRSLTDDNTVKMFLAVEIAMRAMREEMAGHYPDTGEKIMENVTLAVDSVFTAPAATPNATVHQLPTCTLCTRVCADDFCETCG